jgi:hypothetical protein
MSNRYTTFFKNLKKWHNFPYFYVTCCEIAHVRNQSSQCIYIFVNFCVSNIRTGKKFGRQQIISGNANMEIEIINLLALEFGI